jgi:hypothetical protein
MDMLRKSHLAAIALVAVGGFYSTSAFAQTAQAAGTTTAGVNITLQGTIQSSIVLAVSGVAGNTDLTGPSQTTMPARAAGTVDFGSFSTQSASPTGTGSLVRAGSGAYAIARLAFTPTYSGNAGGPNACNVNLTLGTAGGTSPIAANNTRLNNTYSGTNAVGGWTATGAHQGLAATPVSACPNRNATAGNCASGSTYTHELAVYVPDTQEAGTFSQVVLYDATTY